MMKLDYRAKVGLLQPLKIPTWKCAHVPTDLVIDLLESEEFTAIMIFMDKLSEMVHLAPSKKEINAMEYAKLFVENVFRHHSLPKVMICDRDPCFAGKV